MTNPQSNRTQNIVIEDKMILFELAKKLVECEGIQDNLSRNTLVNWLPLQIRQNIETDGKPLIHTLNIVDTCARFPGGLDELIQLVYYIEGNTSNWQRVEEFVRPFAWTGKVLPDTISNSELVTAKTSVMPQIKQVLNETAEVISNRKKISSKVRPINLPGVPPEIFYGRENDLKQVVTLLKTVGRVNIWGMPGVGKSSLALRVGRELKTEFPGGMLYLNLVPQEYPESLNLALQELTVLLELKDDPLQLSPDNKKDRLLWLLGNFSQVLLVLDNADYNSELVHSIIRKVNQSQESGLSSNHGLLVTSRRSFDAIEFKLESFELKPIDDLGASFSIFQSYYRPELKDKTKLQKLEEEISDILKYCAGLPLALELAGRRASERAIFRVDDLKRFAEEMKIRLDELETSQPDLTEEQRSVKASFELSYLDVKKKPIRAAFFARLSRYPGSFDAKLAANWALYEPIHSGLIKRIFRSKGEQRHWYGPSKHSYEPDLNLIRQAQEYLTYLSRLALLLKVKVTYEQDQLNTVYSFHNLMRAFAAEKLAEQNTKRGKRKLRELRPEIQLREAEFLAHQAAYYVQAGLYAASFEPYTKAIELYTGLNKREEIAQLLMEYGEALGYQQKYEQAESQLYQATILYQELNNAVRESQALERLVEVYIQGNKQREALDSLTKLENLYIRVGDFAGQARSDIRRAELFLKMNDYEQAEGVYRELTRQRVKRKEQSGNALLYEAIIEERLGDFWRQQDKPARAIGHYLEAFELNRQLSNNITLISVAFVLAELYNVLNQPDRATYYNVLVERTRIQSLTGWDNYYIDSLIKYGTKLIYKDKLYNVALTIFESALDLSRALELRQSEAISIHCIGRVWLERKDYDKALYYFEQALPIFKEIATHKTEAVTLHYIGRVWLEREDYDKALQYFEEALPIYQEVADHHGEAVNLHMLGRVWFEREDYDKALYYFEQALPLYKLYKDDVDLIGDAINLRFIGEVWFNRKDYDKALYYFEQALAFDKEIPHQYSEALDLYKLGLVWSARENYEEALHYFEQALPLFKEVNNHEYERLNLDYLSWICFFKRKDYDKALHYFEQALPLFKEITDRKNEARILNTIGLIWFERKDYDKALHYFEEALPLYKEDFERRGEANNLYMIARVWFEQKNHDKVLQFLGEAFQVGWRAYGYNDQINEADLTLVCKRWLAIEDIKEATDFFWKVVERGPKGWDAEETKDKEN